MQQSYPFWVKPTSVSFQTFSTWRIKKTSSKNDMVELFLNDIFGKIGQYIILLLQLGNIVRQTEGVYSELIYPHHTTDEILKIHKRELKI